MQDGLRARITLLSSSKQQGVVYYHFQIQNDQHIFKWSERYSKLREICADLPATTVKFPPKDTLRSLINNLTTSEGFLPERFALLKQYFISVGNTSQLRLNRAFIQICRNLEKVKEIKAPVIKGKQLKTIDLTKKDNYILV